MNIKKYNDFISEDFDTDDDLIYTVIYDDKILGCFTSDLKAKEAIKQHVDSLINTYQTVDIESIEEYKEELAQKAKITSFLLDRLYDDKKIEK